MADELSADLLRAAMDQQHVTDNDTRAGLAAIAMGESGMQGYTETGYAHTPNARIRLVFGSRVANLSDDRLNALKAADRDFFDWVYGAQFDDITHLGNTQPDDGYNFRGRGFIQLTGRSNYTRYSGKIGHPEIVDSPDLANNPPLAAQLAVAYIVDRYHGGGFSQMMACVGNNTPDIAAKKQAYYDQFVASGEFAAGGAAVAVATLQPGDSGDAVKALQTALIAAGCNCGPTGADGDFGNDTRNAVATFQAARGLPVTDVADAATLAALGLPA